jgi:cytochrome c-type biogenesis protein CcsB
MNHILKHRGYRLYQASFDPDEKGSVLSVSRDPGTPVTYAGYLVMGALLLGAFLHRGSRFRTLAMELTKKPGKPVHAAMLAAMLYAGIAAQAIAGPGSATTNRDHCLRFSELLVQDKNGRIKPFHSLAAQSLQQTGHPEKGMGLSMEQVSWMLLFSADSAGWSEGFRGAAAALRRSFKPYPVPGDPGKRWVNEPSALEGPDSSAVQLLVSGYRTAVLGKDWTSANAWLDSLGSYQIRHAAAILPSRLKQRAELAYNRLDLFHRLGWIVLLFGAALLAAAAAEARMSSGSLSAVRRVLVFLVSIAFAAFLAGLALRWFVSGHAPWTNKYESMVFIAWAALLAGILSGRFGAFALALGSIGSGLMLRLAHSGNTDPAIGTLAPVLKSKWLVIHVSVITASYGFFLLGGLIALCILLMLAAAPRRSDAGLGGTVRRMSQVQEWTLLAGLLLVMLGNVFGAVWANESWGRYWGWDPKETWTLIVIIAYTAALHVRLIRPLNRPYWLSVFSIAGIACVTMTYWGVNTLLSGMHSYASGGTRSVPEGIWISAAGFLLLAAAAFRKRNLGQGAASVK